MFSTHSETEVRMPFGDDQMRFWPSVHHSLATPWFVVVVESRDEAASMTETILLSDPRQILQLGKNAPILELSLMSPGYINGAGRWMLDPLAEILEGEEPNSPGQIANVYVLENRSRYVDSALRTKEADLLNNRTLFSTTQANPINPINNR